MIEVQAEIRKWGNSYGVVIPMKEIKKAQLKEHDKVRLNLQPERPLLVKDIFGKLHWGASTEQLMAEIDEMDSKFLG